MSDRNPFILGKIALALFVVLVGANNAMAYVGPGADVAFISYAMTLLAWVLAAFSAVFMWPIYALLRRIRGGNDKSTTTASKTVAEEARAPSTTSQ